MHWVGRDHTYHVIGEAFGHTSARTCLQPNAPRGDKGPALRTPQGERRDLKPGLAPSVGLSQSHSARHSPGHIRKRALGSERVNEHAQPAQFLVLSMRERVPGTQEIDGVAEHPFGTARLALHCLEERSVLSRGEFERAQNLVDIDVRYSERPAVTERAPRETLGARRKSRASPRRVFQRFVGFRPEVGRGMAK